MRPESERRRATRVETSIEARLIDAQGVAIPARLVNLSLVGLLAETAVPLPVGSPCRVELEVDGAGLDAAGRVVRAGGGRVAVQLESLPYESFERLRAFLIEHATDPAVVRAELSERLGFLGDSAA